MESIRLDPTNWAQALDDVAGPQLVVAGPGTGKTEFLVRRAARIVEAGHAPAGGILVLTFSRRSAGEIGARIGAVLGRGAGVDSSTFHSYAHRLLEVHGGGEIGTLLTGPEQVRLVAELLERENPSDWPLPFRSILGSTTFAEEVADFLLRCQERLVEPDGIAALAERRSDWRAIPALFRRYEALLRNSGRIDYGTLLLDAIACLQRPEVARSVAAQHRFVLVDEYQDTSPAQARLLEAISRTHRNITVTGDPYQSVYSFRGADLRNLAEFPTRFRRRDGGEAKRLILSTSFRVPGAIMEAALRVTSQGELPGSAGSVEPAPHPGRVEAYVFDQQSAEAEWIAAEVERLVVEEAIPLRRIAVLVRSKRRLLPELSRALDRRRIPHDEPDVRLVDHPMVRLILDLTRAAAWSALDPHLYPGAADEVDRLMRRVLLGPLLAIPVTMERSLLRERVRRGIGWAEILRERVPSASGIPDLLSHPEWATQHSATEGFWRAWTGIDALGRIAVDPAAVGERAALTAFAQALGRQAERDPRLTLLDYAVLADEEDFEATPLLSAQPSLDRVALTTLHQAKGLEFDAVFIADAVEDVFPDTRRPRALLEPHALIVDAEAGDHARFRLQEEMRLAYTAMTRARSRVVWTATGAGVEESGSRPSRFLLAAAGVDAVVDLPPAPDRSGTPVSVIELESVLRRTVVDPGEGVAARLAAVTVLARPPSADMWDVRTFAGVAAPGPDHGLVEAPLRLSASQAEAYDRCPRRYAFEQRVRLGGGDSPYATFGSLIHAVLEGAERSAMVAGLPRSDVSTALTLLDRLIEEYEFGSEVLVEAWRSRGRELLMRLYQQWPSDSAQIISLEHRFRLEVDGATWTGRIDRIELTDRRTLRVVDYKTGSTVTTRAEAAASLQLGLYWMAIAADEHIDTDAAPLEAEFWFPLARAKSWRVPFDPSNLDSISSRLKTVAAGIAAEEWAPRVGPGCRTCPVRLVCDRWPEGREAFVE